MTSTAFFPRLLLAAAVCLPGVCAASPDPSPPTAKPSVPVPANAGPTVEIVFALDSTGSMGGLLSAAKKKIWAIANEFAGATPRPTIRIGLVAYRDANDAYVTRRSALTADLDAFYGDLKQLSAGGGGDTPEAVDQGLAVAIERFDWSPEAKLRFVFLVGDAPPHADKVAECTRLAGVAAQKGIVLNTILCGTSRETHTVWTQLAQAAGGQFLAIDQNATVQAVATPYDGKIAEAQTRIENTALFYGSAAEQRKYKGLWRSNNDGSLSKEQTVDRASCLNKTGGYYSQDLIQALDQGKLKLDELRPKQLPEELRALPPAAREAKLAALKAERAAANAALEALVVKRDGWLRANVASDSSFDRQLVDCLKTQAKAELTFSASK